MLYTTKTERLPSGAFGQQVNVTGCFYHLTQSTWRKIQELGLSVAYRDNKTLKHFCGMLDGLAFLPLTDVVIFFCQTELRGLENFYAMSYLWFLPCGALVTMFVGIIASFITSKCN